MNAGSILSVIVITLAVQFTSGQEVIIRLSLIDSQNETVITGAHILDEDKKVITTTNASGMASFKKSSLHSDIIHISHISYRDTTISIRQKSTTIKIELVQLKSVLDHFTVVGEPVELIPDKPWFVTSYIHTRYGLLLLAYPQRRLSNQSLFLLNEKGDVLSQYSWRTYGDLFEDAAGDIWLKGRNHTWLIEVNEKEIDIGKMVMKTSDFSSGLEKIKKIINDNFFYFGHHTHDNQWLNYYCYNHRETETQSVYTITNEIGLILRETRHIFETNEFERRFSEMCFFSPVYAPLAKIDNQLLVFDYYDGRIVWIDTTHKITNSVDVDYHHDNQFKEILISDKVTEKFYTVFAKNGIYTIKEIDLDTGGLSKKITLPSFPYIENITVHNGRLYFLYKAHTRHKYKKIYVTPIGS